jgi:hypothetical protein
MGTGEGYPRLGVLDEKRTHPNTNSQLMNVNNWVWFVAKQLRIAHNAIRVNNVRGVNPDTPDQFLPRIE